MPDSENLDARAVANAILQMAWERGINDVSNLKLQKLLFLCHGLFLFKTGGGNLINGSFEAWQYGPVHRGAYDAFKACGDQPITELAQRLNPVTRERTPIAMPDMAVQHIIYDIVTNYGNWSAARLVGLTHTKGGPWDHVVTQASNNANMALRIGNDVIRERFKNLWFGKQPPTQGEIPDEEKILIA